MVPDGLNPIKRILATAPPNVRNPYISSPTTTGDMLPAKQHSGQSFARERQIPVHLVRLEEQHVAGAQVEPKTVARHHQVAALVIAEREQSNPAVPKVVLVGVVCGLPVPVEIGGAESRRDSERSRGLNLGHLCCVLLWKFFAEELVTPSHGWHDAFQVTRVATR